MEIKKAIMPAVENNAAFSPFSKFIPKEMLPILHKPAMQLCVEEGIKSGLQNFILINSSQKKLIEDHFDEFAETEKKKSRQTLFTFVHQRELLGSGHAILSARHCVGKEYISVITPSDLIYGSTPAIGQLMKVALQEKCNIVAVAEVPLEQSSKHSIVSIRRQFSPNLFQLKDVTENPTTTQAASNLAIVGRYVFTPEIFSALEEVAYEGQGEISITQGIKKLILNGEKVFAYKIHGTHYSTKTPIDWLKATISLSLTHPEYSEEMLKYLQSLDKEMLVMKNRVEALGKNFSI